MHSGPTRSEHLLHHEDKEAEQAQADLDFSYENSAWLHTWIPACREECPLPAYWRRDQRGFFHNIKTNAVQVDHPLKPKFDDLYLQSLNGLEYLLQYREHLKLDCEELENIWIGPLEDTSSSTAAAPGKPQEKKVYFANTLTMQSTWDNPFVGAHFCLVICDEVLKHLHQVAVGEDGVVEYIDAEPWDDEGGDVYDNTYDEMQDELGLYDSEDEGSFASDSDSDDDDMLGLDDSDGDEDSTSLQLEDAPRGQKDKSGRNDVGVAFQNASKRGKRPKGGHNSHLAGNRLPAVPDVITAISEDGGSPAALLEDILPGGGAGVEQQQPLSKGAVAPAGKKGVAAPPAGPGGKAGKKGAAAPPVPGAKGAAPPVPDAGSGSVASGKKGAPPVPGAKGAPEPPGAGAGKKGAPPVPGAKGAAAPPPAAKGAPAVPGKGPAIPGGKGAAVPGGGGKGGKGAAIPGSASALLAAKGAGGKKGKGKGLVPKGKPKFGRKWHWKPLSNIEATVWESLKKDQSLSAKTLLNIEKLEEFFQVVVKAPSKPTGDEAKVVADTRGVLEGGRLHVVGIGLSRFSELRSERINAFLCFPKLFEGVGGS
eukprot:g8021.t1